ncbi:MAG: FtsK/SpoIIIE family DNA translocase [Planctomycetota bacterium]|jgi:S-DNA-T family DNA segregation ATPase FtsK/SpoIIIE
MDKRSKLRLALGLALAAFAVFAFLSLVSHSSGDPGGWDYVPGGKVRNWCGLTGAYFSGFLMRNFGAAAAAFAVGLAVFYAHLLLVGKTELSDAYLKVTGAVILVVMVSALSALAGGGEHFTSVVGKAVEHWTVHYFGPTGAYIVIGLCALLSLLLATDFMVVAPVGRFALAAGGFIHALAARCWGRIFRRRGEMTVRRAPTRSVPIPTAVRKRPPEPSPVAEDAPTGPPAVAGVPEPSAPAKTEGPAEAARRPKRREAVGGYTLPSVELLDEPPPLDSDGMDAFIQEKARVLEETLAEFGIHIEVVGIETGPVITMYEVTLAPGIKVTRVLSLSDDIAMALKAPSVRIVAPIPGRDSIGIEVPNVRKAIVRLRTLLEEVPAAKAGRIPVYIGRDAKGQPLVSDLTELPHLLIAGTTGSGKSVCINSIICSVLMQRHPDDVKLLLVDPKMVELASFRDLPHLICPVVTDIPKAAAILDWACAQMDARYDYLAAVGVRHISRYNKLGAAGIRERLKVPDDAEIELPDKLPYIIIIIDELADLMMIAAKDIETSITRLAQKSRAVGLHLVLATQRPSVDVITGLIKSNLPARLSFKVFSRIDSRTILDQNGAEKLLGEGDMLYLPPATARLVRAQGTFVSDEEIRRVADFVKEQAKPDYNRELVEWKAEKPGAVVGAPAATSRDDLYDDAVRIVIENQRGSVSLLQRRLEIGYGRAARLIDQMAEEGILGPYKGSQAREVLYTIEQWEQMQESLGRSLN